MMELLKIANGSGALKKAEVQNSIKKLVNKSVLPEEIDLIIPAFNDDNSFQFNETEFMNMMHILHWKPIWIQIDLINEFDKRFFCNFL